MELTFRDYGQVGTSKWERTYRHPGEGWIVMVGARPTADHIATEDGGWILPEVDPAPSVLYKDLTIEQADMLCEATDTEAIKMFLMEVFSG